MLKISTSEADDGAHNITQPDYRGFTCRLVLLTSQGVGRSRTERRATWSGNCRALPCSMPVPSAFRASTGWYLLLTPRSGLVQFTQENGKEEKNRYIYHSGEVLLLRAAWKQKGLAAAAALGKDGSSSHCAASFCRWLANYPASSPLASRSRRRHSVTLM